MPLDFNYGDCIATTDLHQGGALANWDFFAHTSLVPAFGRLLILNGVDENRLLYDGTQVGQSWPLVGPPPTAPILPMISAMGNGRVFGFGYVWYYRYKDSRSGAVSGLSPTPPHTIDMGAETTPGAATYVGQQAAFYLAGISDTLTNYDRIQLIRNTSSQSEILFVVDEKANPGSGGSVLFQDNFPDEEIITNELVGLLPNASVEEGGPPWPCAKAYIHPNGRVWLYGVVRHPPFIASAAVGATTTNGENTLTFSGIHTFSFPRGPTFTGERFDTLTVTESQSYHTFSRGGDVIYPDWAETSSTYAYEFDDDRDGRVVFVSEPGLPQQYDPIRTFFLGKDPSDDLMHIVGMGGVTYAFTRYRIIALDGDMSLDPSVSIRQTVLADEGQAGFHTGCETPVGYVYVNERGVRVFDGQSAPHPLGEPDPDKPFPAKTQFDAFDKDLLHQCRVFYDPDAHIVLVSYAPVGAHGLRETMAYDLKHDCWRGPWRIHLNSVFRLRNDSGAPVTAYGDALGNVSTVEGGALDVMSLYTGQSTAATVGNVEAAFLMRPGTGTWDPNADLRYVGAPAVFTTAGGVVTLNWVAGTGTSTNGDGILLLELPASPLSTSTAFQLGAVRWLLRLAWIDAGEPILPKLLKAVRMRLVRGAVSASAGSISAAIDGNTSFSTGEGASETTVVADSTNWATGRINRTGRSHQIQFQGTSLTGDPQATVAIAELVVDAGT